MKRIGEYCTITVRRWDGPFPEPWDLLRTPTGRTYEVAEVDGNRLTCRVVDPNAQYPEGTRVFDFRWLPRVRKEPR
jgi:hypothetical protein